MHAVNQNLSDRNVSNHLMLVTVILDLAVYKVWFYIKNAEYRLTI